MRPWRRKLNRKKDRSADAPDILTVCNIRCGLLHARLLIPARPPSRRYYKRTHVYVHPHVQQSVFFARGRA